jgi:hypothetical protein
LADRFSWRTTLVSPTALENRSLRSKKMNRQQMRNAQPKNKVMIGNRNIIENGCALSGQMRTPGQPPQRNSRHCATPAVLGLTAAQPASSFNYFVNRKRTSILNEGLIISFFLIIFLSFMIFVIGSVMVCLF